MSSYILNIKNENNDFESNHEDYNEVEELLTQGVEKIYQSFKITTKRYKEKIKEQEKIINNLTKKIEVLNQEIGIIQNENQYYKTKNEQQKKEIDKLNKIVNNIRGKLSSVDHQINECIKEDTINILNYKNNYENKKKHNNFYIGLKNKKEEQSLFQLNSKNSFKEDRHDLIQKNINNKKFPYYLDNNFIKQNNNKNNYENNYENNTINNEDDINKKFKKSVGCNSLEVNININKNNNCNTNGKLNIKTPNLVLNKDVITREEKMKKSNNKEKSEDKMNENSLSSFQNKKSKSYSFKQFIKENDIIYQTNKTINKVETNKNNDDDLNINKMNKKNKGYEGQICFTDNIFNKMNTTKKKSYNSLRSKILNKNIADYFKRNDNNSNNNNLYEKSGDLNIYIEKKSDEISYFLRKCKILLNKESFEEIVKLFQEYKEGLITDEGILLKTQNYLEKNKELIELFKNVFAK